MSRSPEQVRVRVIGDNAVDLALRHAKQLQGLVLCGNPVRILKRSSRKEQDALLLKPRQGAVAGDHLGDQLRLRPHDRGTRLCVPEDSRDEPKIYPKDESGGTAMLDSPSFRYPIRITLTCIRYEISASFPR